MAKTTVVKVESGKLFLEIGKEIACNPELIRNVAVGDEVDISQDFGAEGKGPWLLSFMCHIRVRAVLRVVLLRGNLMGFVPFEQNPLPVVSVTISERPAVVE